MKSLHFTVFCAALVLSSNAYASRPQCQTRTAFGQAKCLYQGG